MGAVADFARYDLSGKLFVKKDREKGPGVTTVSEAGRALIFDCFVGAPFMAPVP